MADLTEIDDLEPLFDYHRVQHNNVVCLEDDDDTPAIPHPKRRKSYYPAVGKKLAEETKEVQVISCEDEEDWLPPPPPPEVLVENQLSEDSAIKELRLKKQELLSFAKSAEDELRAVEESIKRKHGSSVQALLEAEAEKQPKLACKRPKIVITVQDKDGPKQFRMFADDKFERLFKMYAHKVNLDQENLVFCFDGDKIGPAATPAGLGMEDDDIIEAHVKKS